MATDATRSSAEVGGVVAPFSLDTTDASRRPNSVQDAESFARTQFASVLQMTKQIAWDAIRKQGGMEAVLAGLDQSGFNNGATFFTALTIAVTTLHTRIALSSVGELPSREELTGTVTQILNQAFASHGVRLQTTLDEITARRVTNEDESLS